VSGEQHDSEVWRASEKWLADNAERLIRNLAPVRVTAANLGICGGDQ
jgi:hypothetical protein